MKYISALTLIMTISFVTNGSPVFLNFILILQTLIFAKLLGTIYNMYWFSYVLFLIMVGGVLILITYVVSTLPVYKSKMHAKIFLIMPVILLVFLFVGMEKIYPTSSFEKVEWPDTSNARGFISLICLYHDSSNLINIFLITFLFVLLLMVEKISIYQLGMLRMK